MSYDANAKRIANFVRQQAARRHQGVMQVEDGVAAVFGNDDYSFNHETREQVRLVILSAFERDQPVLGFAVDDADGEAWALVMQCDDLDWLKARVHDAWFESHLVYSSGTGFPPAEADGARRVAAVS